MKAISLFSGGGIGDSGLRDIGVQVQSSLEIVEDRVRLSGYINSETKALLGDIRDQSVRDSITESAPDIDLLIMTPPCQGVSVAGKGRGQNNRLLDERNFLLFPAIELLERLEPKHVVIENVPQFLNLSLPYKNNLLAVPELLKEILGDRYRISFAVLDASKMGVPQYRRRAFIHLSRNKEPIDFDKIKFVNEARTVRQEISHLPSLESGESSHLFWHFARSHSDDHVRWLRHTPTGKSAVDNKLHYPKKTDGSRVKTYNTTYRRMKWDEPAPTITMRNDAISSQRNVHPGRKNRDGTYSDARVLSVHELMLLMGINPRRLPADREEELNIRRSLGEGIPPRLLNSVIEMVS